MKKFTTTNLVHLLGLIKTLVSTTKTEITSAYEALVGALGNDKNGNKHTVKSYVDEAIEAVNGDNTALETRVKANEDAIETINGDASTEGSFKKYVADFWATMTNADGGTIDKLNEVLAWFKGVTAPGADTEVGATLIADVAANKTAVTTTLPNAITKAQEDAEAHADEAAGTAETNAKSYADTVSGTAETNAKAYTDQQIEAIEAYTEAEIQGAWDEVFNPAPAA